MLKKIRLLNEVPPMNRFDSLALCLLAMLPLSACTAPWDRSLYEGMRQGANNAAQQPAGRAVPQGTPLPDHERYEAERKRLRGDTAGNSPEPTDAAASAAAR